MNTAPERPRNDLVGVRKARLMASENTLKGNRITGKLRAPRTTDEERTCAAKDCYTVLSRYNKREHCFAHAPTRFPRLRGRIVPEA